MLKKLDESFMCRALRLASNAGPAIMLNPPVGCVIVHNNRIIGEGFHAQYGEAHAEVNAINSIHDSELKYLAGSTVYVTLEPCSHYGKTPPCAHLLVNSSVERVVIGCIDPNIEVAGKGARYLQENKIEITVPFLENYARELIKTFSFHLQIKRPFVCLKWAQSHDGYLGKKGKEIAISGPSAQFQVHRWRSQFQAILVGSGTVITDNPQLDNRLTPGCSPARVILDRRKRLNGSEKVFRDDKPTVYYYTIDEKNKNLPSHVIQNTVDKETFLQNVLSDLYQHKIASLLVEGGAEVLKSFLDAGLYEEIRLIRSDKKLGKGIRAPLTQDKLIDEWKLEDDSIYRLEKLD